MTDDIKSLLVDSGIGDFIKEITDRQVIVFYSCIDNCGFSVDYRVYCNLQTAIGYSDEWVSKHTCLLGDIITTAKESISKKHICSLDQQTIEKSKSLYGKRNKE